MAVDAVVRVITLEYSAEFHVCCKDESGMYCSHLFIPEERLPVRLGYGVESAAATECVL